MTRKTRRSGAVTPAENGNAESEDGFRWLGSGVKVNRQMHFGKCEVDGMKVSVGDNVEIKLDKNSAVAEIREMYETVGENPHRARIRWYYPFKDIPRKYKQFVEKPIEKELFKPEDGLFLGSEEVIDVETIINTVTVWEIGEDDTPPPGDYFVRYCFPANSENSQQRLIPILGDMEVDHSMADEEDDDDDEDEEDEGEDGDSDDEVLINYTKIKGHADNTNGNGGISKTPSQVEGNGVASKEGALSGKMKKNAQKWKSFSADEVLAELWKTDKDTGGRSGKKSNLKRKLDSCSTDKTNSSNNNSIDEDNESKGDLKSMDAGTNASPLVSEERQSADASDTVVTKEIDFDVPDSKANDDAENKAADGDSDFSLNVNKNMSPFKTIPKRKEANAVSVFDFDDDTGGSNYSLKINRSGKKDGDALATTKSNKKKKSNLTDPKTKKSNARSKTPAKTVSTKKKGEGTPGISQRKTPRTEGKNMLALARKRLHVSAVPETLPCRDDQFSQIFSFVQDRLKEGTGGCMYISGVPGTGKTATVREVVRTLRENIEESVIPEFKFVEINGMKLTDPNQAYTEILKALEGKKATPDHAADLLSQRFRALGPNKENVVLLVDELDLLCTRKQNVMYNIFEWPTHKRSKLVVLAVANTMDLPERMMMNRVSSRLGLTRMTFQPYTFKELEEIILSRIRGTDAFEDDALQLVARKVAAVSGDARRCLDICRRAVEISENVESKKSGKGSGDMVNMKHVELALKEMFSSPKIMALQCLSEMETMFMKAVISEFRRTGLEEAIFLEVYDQFKSHCTLEDGIDAPNMSQAFTICSNLGSCRLLLVEAGNKDVQQRVRLNVNVDDAMFAFKSRGS